MENINLKENAERQNIELAQTIAGVNVPYTTLVEILTAAHMWWGIEGVICSHMEEDGTFEDIDGSEVGDAWEEYVDKLEKVLGDEGGEKEGNVGWMRMRVERCAEKIGEKMMVFGRKVEEENWERMIERLVEEMESGLES